MNLLCIGDVALAAEKDLFQQEWATPGEATPGDETRILFNWELPIGVNVNPTPRSSGSRLLAIPDSPRLIKRWAPGYATLATNHVLDAGEAGLANTIEALQREGFKTMGAGQTREEIEAPIFWETDEGRLAILNWVFLETHPDWMAVPGPNCWPGVERAEKTIKQLKSEADWVMVVAHWSDECFSYPRPEDRVIARELAQAGADLIVGHHPHVVRGMEIIGSCQVFYSIGNFYFSNIPDKKGGWRTRQAPRNREALGVRVSFRRGERPEYQFLSFWQTGSRVISDPLYRAIRRLKAVNRPLRKFQDSEYINWYGVERARFDWLDYRWYFSTWKLGIRGLIRYFLRLFDFLKPSNT